jgi:hypothetical protein
MRGIHGASCHRLLSVKLARGTMGRDDAELNRSIVMQLREA